MALFDAPTETLRIVNRRISAMYRDDAAFHHDVDMAVRLAAAAHTEDLRGDGATRRAMTYAAAWAVAMTRPEIDEVVAEATAEAQEQHAALLRQLPASAVGPFNLDGA